MKVLIELKEFDFAYFAILIVAYNKKIKSLCKMNILFRVYVALYVNIISFLLSVKFIYYEFRYRIH